MKQKIIIIDDFYENPWEMHNLAINAKYEDKNQGNYPGLNSEKSFLTEESHKKICQVLGKKVFPSKQTSCGHFRISKNNQVGKLKIHADMFDDWAAVLYLTLPSHCEGKPGTSFYVHKQTGLDHWPNDHEMKFYGWKNMYELKKGFCTVDGNDTNSWYKYSTIFMKYNRMVLFDSKLWHSNEDSFGDNIDNCRIVQLFFLTENVTDEIK